MCLINQSIMIDMSFYFSHQNLVMKHHWLIFVFVKQFSLIDVWTIAMYVFHYRNDHGDQQVTSICYEFLWTNECGPMNVD